MQATDAAFSFQPHSLVAGMPDPPTIQKQKDAYMKMLDDQMKQSTLKFYTWETNSPFANRNNFRAQQFPVCMGCFSCGAASLAAIFLSRSSLLVYYLEESCVYFLGLEALEAQVKQQKVALRAQAEQQKKQFLMQTDMEVTQQEMVLKFNQSQL